MTGIEWIAALLNPWDVAPHPNFMNAERVTESSLLALIVQLRLVDYQRAISPSSRDEAVGKLNIAVGSPAYELVLAAAKSIQVGTQQEGANELAHLATGNLDPGARAAAAVLASVALAELDDYDRVLFLLLDCLNNLSPADTADDRLIRAVVLQQLSMRRNEAGLEGAEHSEEARRLLAGLRRRDFSNFPTTKGVSWRSNRTIGEIVDQLRATVEAHIANARPDRIFDDWMRFVRAPAPDLSLRTERRVVPSNWAFVKELFADKVASSVKTLAAQDPVEPGVYAILLHNELLGDAPAARQWRTRLGMLRLLRNDDPEFAGREAIRLFRQAEDLDSLDHALRFVRSEGPLSALLENANQVVNRRLVADRLRPVELAVLASAAPVLDAETAGRAMDGVLAGLRENLPARTRNWQLFAVRAERAWLASVALAATARRLDDVAMAIFDACRERPTDELLDRSLTRAASAVDWDEVGDDARLQWSAWLDDPASSASPGMREAIGPDLGVGAHAEPSGDVTLGRVASWLNLYFRTNQMPQRADIERATELVVTQLGAIQRNAAAGTYSFGAVPVADVATGLGLYWSVDAVWPPLATLLSDPRVNLSDKAPALERLALRDSNAPEGFVRQLGDALNDVLQARTIGPFEDKTTIMPAALRFAIRYGLLSDERTVEILSSLFSSRRTTDRVEAARTMTLIADLRHPPDWTVILAYELSRDDEALVRAEAGRCLGLLARTTTRLSRLVNDRMIELLSDDGLLVPLLVLRGLMSATDLPLEAAVTRRIQQLSAAHLAYGVRVQARAVLDRTDLTADATGGRD